MDLVVWGAWEQVRAVPGYAEVLAAQAPEGARDAAFSEYYIPCATGEDLFAAAAAFRAAGLGVGVQVGFRSQDAQVILSVITGSGYGRNLPHCEVVLRSSRELTRAKVRQAIALLKEIVE
jgi:hypothetical protein